MASGSGLRCSSIGVPMTTMTVSASPTAAESVVASSEPDSRTRARTGSAPGSMKGTRPALIALTVSALMSHTSTRAPRSASAIDSGRPT